jgi:Clathrin adaptor complex small chain
MSHVLFPVSAVILLDYETGAILLAKYFDHDPILSINTDNTKLDAHAIHTVRTAFERKLGQKLKQTSHDIISFDGHTVIYKVSQDIIISIVALSNTNELLLSSLLNAIYDASIELYKPVLDKRAIFESYEWISLLISEAIDRGVILECDTQTLIQRVQQGKRGSVGEELGHALEGQSFASAFAFAKERVKGALLRH